MNSGEARRLWRRSIKAAWGNRCAYCNHTPIDDDSLRSELTIDHVRPRSNGGEDRTKNCIPACRRCNQSKASANWVDWYREQDFYEAWREVQIRHWLSTGQVLQSIPLDDDMAA